MGTGNDERLRGEDMHCLDRVQYEGSLQTLTLTNSGWSSTTLHSLFWVKGKTSSVE